MIIISTDDKLYELAAFAAASLNLLDEDLEVDIQIKPELKDLMFGYMMGDEDLYVVRVYEADPLTVFHEMVHVDQYVKGRLVKRNGNAYWNNQLVPISVPYLDRPWEQEAELMAHVLQSQWDYEKCE